MVMGLSMKGRKYQKMTKVTHEVSLNHSFLEGKEPICHREGFMREKLLEP